MDKALTRDDGSPVKEFRVTWSKMCEACCSAISARAAVRNYGESRHFGAHGEAYQRECHRFGVRRVRHWRPG